MFFVFSCPFLVSRFLLCGFGKFGLEWDRFKAFDLRVNLNGGIGYHWIRQDDASFVTDQGRDQEAVDAPAHD